MVYLKVVPVLVRPVRVCTCPSLNSCVSTASKVRSGSTTAGLNSTVHVTVTLDLPGAIGLGGSLVIFTDISDGTADIEVNMHYYRPIKLPRVHKKEKRVSNCTIAAHKRCFRSTKYTCVCLVLHSGMLLSKQLYKSMLNDLST